MPEDGLKVKLRTAQFSLREAIAHLADASFVAVKRSKAAQYEYLAEKTAIRSCTPVAGRAMACRQAFDAELFVIRIYENIKARVHVFIKNARYTPSA